MSNPDQDRMTSLTGMADALTSPEVEDFASKLRDDFIDVLMRDTATFAEGGTKLSILDIRAAIELASLAGASSRFIALHMQRLNPSLSDESVEAFSEYLLRIFVDCLKRAAKPLAPLKQSN